MITWVSGTIQLYQQERIVNYILVVPKDGVEGRTAKDIYPLGDPFGRMRLESKQKTTHHGSRIAGFRSRIPVEVLKLCGDG